MSRILIVEDDADVAELLDVCFGTLVEGATTERAADGLAALERFEAGEHFDLVVCDIMMPGMDGARLVREIASRGIDSPPFLVLSAVASGELTEILEQDFVVGYLQKPVDPMELAQWVAAVLST